VLKENYASQHTGQAIPNDDERHTARAHPPKAVTTAVGYLMNILLQFKFLSFLRPPRCHPPTLPTSCCCVAELVKITLKFVKVLWREKSIKIINHFP